MCSQISSAEVKDITCNLPHIFTYLAGILFRGDAAV